MEIEPYTFSLTDSRRTLVHALDLLDDYPEAARPHKAERRAAIADVVAGIDPRRADAADLEELVRRVWPLLLGARDDLVAAGAAPPTATGAAAHLAASGGGVPKISVERIQIGFGGVDGDKQATRQHHGAPWQAVCLWSAEVLAALADEGHPVAPGGVGENVLIEGLAWDTITPGVRLQVGTAIIDVTSYAVPCSTIAFNFSDRDFNRIDSERGPLSRVYGVVRQPGVASVGDEVVREPIEN